MSLQSQLFLSYNMIQILELFGVKIRLFFKMVMILIKKQWALFALNLLFKMEDKELQWSLLPPFPSGHYVPVNMWFPGCLMKSIRWVFAENSNWVYIMAKKQYRNLLITQQLQCLLESVWKELKSKLYKADEQENMSYI